MEIIDNLIRFEFGWDCTVGQEVKEGYTFFADQNATCGQLW